MGFNGELCALELGIVRTILSARDALARELQMIVAGCLRLIQNLSYLIYVSVPAGALRENITQAPAQ